MAAVLLNISMVAVSKAIVAQEFVASQAARDVGDDIFAHLICKNTILNNEIKLKSIKINCIRTNHS